MTGLSLRKWGFCMAVLSLSGFAGPAQAAGVAEISNLSDVAFGSIIDFASDLSISQTVCAYSSTLPSRYSVTGTGSGAGNAFTLTNGTGALPYEVQWNAAAGQTSGTKLTAGSALANVASSGLLPGCTLGLTLSGTLTVVLRSADLSSAQSGMYTGTLTILLSPS
ncbi:MAG: hypothetical protein ABW169_10005 [Sphingobium sp.]